MFTGIAVRGEVTGITTDAQGSEVWVRSALLADCEIGASVSINGVCMTVTERKGDVCRFDASLETLLRSTLSDLADGDGVNVERPVRAGAELGGHVVQGHVDGVGVVRSSKPEGEGRRVRVDVPAELTRYMVEKGSVTVDGIALTITHVDDDGFEVALIPHTLAVTTLGETEAGRRVNIEVDILAKYVEKLAGASRAAT